MERGDVVRQRQHGNSLGAVRLFPRPGPKLYTGIVWWAFGLYALFLARAPYTPSTMEQAAYDQLMGEAQFSEEAREAQRDFMQAQSNLDKVHVFGWRWREPYSRLVPPRQMALEEARQRLDAAVRERDAMVSEAKSQVGIWSQYGVDEVRDRFWQAYQSGKDFAKRCASVCMKRACAVTRDAT